MEEKIIGGEMEFDTEVLKKPSVNNFDDCNSYYSCGRSALYTILRTLSQRKYSRILLPDYLCSSVVTAVLAAEYSYDFYRLNDSFLPNIADIGEKIDERTVVLIINYFGFLDLSSTIDSIRGLSSSITIIEDDVQAFYRYLDSNTMAADYSFTSLRKWLPVPDGGFAKCKNGSIVTPNRDNGFWSIKLSGLALKGLKGSLGNIDNIYLELLERGEQMIDDYMSATGSEITIEVLSRTDLNHISLVRQRNAERILTGIKNLGLKPAIFPADNTVPFFIPIVLDNRDSVRRNLFKHNIFCPIHWPTDGLKLERGAFMAAHELSIIIDHRYDTDDMNRILDVISQSI